MLAFNLTHITGAAGSVWRLRVAGVGTEMLDLNALPVKTVVVVRLTLAPDLVTMLTHVLANDFQPEQTPSTHRQRLSTQIPRTQSVSQNIGISPNLPRAVPNRQPLTGLSANSLSSGFAGHGLSAGLKVSNPAGSVQRPRGWSIAEACNYPELI